MPAQYTKPKSRGFTLLEMVVVIAIIAILTALLLPVLSLARRKAKAAASRTVMCNLLAGLVQYRTDYGVYPVQPGTTNQSIIDWGSGVNTGYYNVPCAAFNSTSANNTPPNPEYTMNGNLVSLLIANKYFDYNTTSLKNGSVLVDYYGSPIVVRFLVLLPGYGSAVSGGTSGAKLTEKVYAWSYGYNMINEIHATATYTNLGLSAYDYTEDQNMNSDTGGDDVCTWR